MRRTALFTSTVIALTGCYSSGTLGVEPPPPAVRAELACAPSELALAWVREEGLSWSAYHPVTLDVAPGNALFFVRTVYGGAAVRARDGETLAEMTHPALDAAWAREAVIDPETRVVEVREIETADVLRTVAPLESTGDWHGHTTATLTPDGERAVLLDCDRESAADRSRTIVREVVIATGAQRRVEVPLSCSFSRPATFALSLPAQDAVLLLGLREPGPEWTGAGEVVPALWIARVDLASGTMSASVELGPERADVHGVALIGEPAAGIVGHALSQDGETLAVVGRDGLLRLFDTRTLDETTEEAIPAAIFVANEASFQPSLESPVAISPAGALFAHVDDESAIVIRDAASGAIAARLDMPFEASTSSTGGAALMTLRLVPDGLLVVGSTGIARFTCGGVIEMPETPASELVLRVEGPSVVRGSIARFTAEVEHATGPVVRFARIAETGGTFGSLGPDVMGYAPGEGTFAVEIVADDGVRRARVERTIEVLPSE